MSPALAPPPAPSHSIGGRSAFQRGKRIFNGQALESATAGDGSDRGRGRRLLGLTRGENHLGVEFSGRRLGLEDDFLRLRREGHEFDADDVAATGEAREFVAAVESGGNRIFFSGEGVRSGDGDAGEWSFARFDGAADFKRCGLRRGCER